MNSTFYTFPQNYRYGRQSFSLNSANVRSGAPEISDYDYDTGSSEKRFVIETYGATRTTQTTITHIFIKGTGITGYSVFVGTGAGTGTGLSSVTIPASGTVNGVQNDLRELGPLSATEVNVTIEGTNARLIEVMFLNELTTISNKYQAINPTKIFRDAISEPNILGNTIKEPGPSRRWRWTTSYQAYFPPDANPSADTVFNTFEENLNFTTAVDFARFPDRVYPASIAGGIDISYVGRLYNQQQFDFIIIEA